MAFDYRKEYKEYYMPKRKPEIVNVPAMNFITENGYVNDMENGRLHHEIYLSDFRRTAPEKLETVIRHPIRKL